MELLDCVAAKFYEEPGVFKLLVCAYIAVKLCVLCQVTIYIALWFAELYRLLIQLWLSSEWISVDVGN